MNQIETQLITAKKLGAKYLLNCVNREDWEQYQVLVYPKEKLSTVIKKIKSDGLSEVVEIYLLNRIRIEKCEI